MKKACIVLALAAVTSLMAADGAEIYKTQCFSCHGEKAVKPALNKSQVIAGWDAAKIEASLKGYKDGTYGGPMKGVMAGQVKNLSEADIKDIASQIAAIK